MFSAQGLSALSYASEKFAGKMKGQELKEEILFRLLQNEVRSLVCFLNVN